MLMYTHTHLNESRIALMIQNFDALDRANQCMYACMYIYIYIYYTYMYAHVYTHTPE